MAIEYCAAGCYTLNENTIMTRTKKYLALQGDKTPQEYVKIAKQAEANGFDRIYVYDDLFYYPAYPVLATMAQHTKTIELGACLLNGFYRHPAMIASNYAYLYSTIQTRAVMGLGRGSFFDLLNMETDETHTRLGYEETAKLIHHFFSGKQEAFNGKLFQTSEKAFLKIPIPAKPHIVTATWNCDMAYLAGKYSHEIQIAEVWGESYLEELLDAFLRGNKENPTVDHPKFSIGGMICVGKTEQEALTKAKATVAVYLPYLHTILKNHGIDPESSVINKISHLSKTGKIDEAARCTPDEIAMALALIGTPEQILSKIKAITSKFPIHGILFSPPYGTSNDTCDNIELLAELFQ